MQAGKYTAAAPARVVSGSCPGAASGISGIHVGSTSWLTDHPAQLGDPRDQSVPGDLADALRRADRDPPEPLHDR